MSTSKKPPSPFAGGGFGGNGFAGSGNKGRPMSNPHRDPYADLGEPTGDLEADTNEEVEALSAAFEGFKQRMGKEKSRFEYAVDAGYWCGICFRTSDDLNAFLDALGSITIYPAGHLDGYELSDKLGLKPEWVDRE